jgi:predicted amidohydrolase YtcJ
MTSLTLTNARIYTLDSGDSVVSNLVIEDGLVKRTFTKPDFGRSIPEGEVLDLKGRIVLPGLIDSHLHLRKYSENLEKIDCETSTKKECMDRVAVRAGSTPKGEWILGHGWNHNNWSGGFGSAGDLDQVAPDHPAYLTGKSLHVSWANNKALDLAGIKAGTPDPPKGKIQRDDQGRPTGILFEDAVKLIEKIIPPRSIEETAESIKKAQHTLWRLGLVGVHDFDKELCLEALLWLDERGELGLRVCKSIPSKYIEKAIQQGYQTGTGSEWLWFGGVKDFADGALGPQTAAMLEPYQGSDQLGMLLMDDEDIVGLGIKAASGGLALSIHSIGDLANRKVIDAIEQLRIHEKESNIDPLPHRIEHLQLINSADSSRLAELGITASMQPLHATSDMEMADAYWGDRTAFAYAPKKQLDHGTLVIFGSDAPVEDPNPWLGIHAAVTRQRTDGSPGPDGWHPDERLGIEETIRGFTTNPALASGRGNLQGKLVRGFWADLIVLETDPFTCPPEDLYKIKPVGTMIDGKWVFRNFK